MNIKVVPIVECSELSAVTLDRINYALNIYGIMSATSMEVGRTTTDVESLNNIIEQGGRECELDAYRAVKAAYDECVKNGIEEVVFCR